MRVQLPPVGSPRRPVAYKLYEDNIYFLFDERKEVFLVKDTDVALFWHKYCRDCSLLHLGQCSGGSPRPLSLIHQTITNHACYRGFEPNTAPRPVIVNLVPHVLRFRLAASLQDPCIFFMGQEEDAVMLYPYLLGNVYNYGLICTNAVANRNLNQFLETLFASLWNADLNYWLDFVKASTYSIEAHVGWLKNIDYEQMMATCNRRHKVCLSMDGVQPLADDDYLVI